MNLVKPASMYYASFTDKTGIDCGIVTALAGKAVDADSSGFVDKAENVGVRGKSEVQHGHKKGANLFLSVTLSKINGFKCSFHW